MKYKLLVPVSLQCQFEKKVQEFSKALRSRKIKHNDTEPPKEPRETRAGVMETGGGQVLRKYKN